FMYSSPLKFRMKARVVAVLAWVYESISTFSANAETSPSMSMMLTVSETWRTVIFTLACGILPSYSCAVTLQRQFRRPPPLIMTSYISALPTLRHLLTARHISRPDVTGVGGVQVHH